MLFSLTLEEPDMKRREGIENTKHIRVYSEKKITKLKELKGLQCEWSRVGQKTGGRNEAGELGWD